MHLIKQTAPGKEAQGGLLFYKHTFCNQHSISIRFFEQRYNPQQQYGSYYGRNETADNAGSSYAQQTKNPAAQNTAYNADYQIDKESETASPHQFAGHKSGNDANDNIPNKIHTLALLKFIIKNNGRGKRLGKKGKSQPPGSAFRRFGILFPGFGRFSPASFCPALYLCGEFKRLNMKIKVHSMLLLALSALLSSCAGKGEKKTQEFVVNTTQAVPASHQNEKEFSFIAQPFRTSELSFRVGGPIDRFEVYAGNHYKHGSIIAEIDPRDFRIRKERAEAIYQQAKAEFERIQKLYEMNNISASAYEKAKADYTTAKTTFDTASYELEDTRLIAPFNGYVGEVYIEKFQDVKATQPVITFIDIDQLKIEIYVTQDMAHAAQSLDTVQVRFDAQPDKVYKAQIVEISKGTTRNNLSYLLTALLPNKDGRLLAGMSGKAMLHASQTGNPTGVTIPQTALCHRPSEGNYVWVVDTDTRQVNRRKVKTGGLLPNGYVAITEGLKDSETIATSGLRFLSEGMQVNINNETASTAKITKQRNARL